jgi:hypothetical protein
MLTAALHQGSQRHIFLLGELANRAQQSGQRAAYRRP